MMEEKIEEKQYVSWVGRSRRKAQIDIHRNDWCEAVGFSQFTHFPSLPPWKSNILKWRQRACFAFCQIKNSQMLFSDSLFSLFCLPLERSWTKLILYVFQPSLTPSSKTSSSISFNIKCVCNPKMFEERKLISAQKTHISWALYGGTWESLKRIRDSFVAVNLIKLLSISWAEGVKDVSIRWINTQS